LLHTAEVGLTWLLLAIAPLLLVALARPVFRGTAPGTGVLVMLLAAFLFVASALLSFRLRCRLGPARRFLLAGALPAILALGTLAGLAVTATTGNGLWTVLGTTGAALVAYGFAGLPSPRTGPARSWFRVPALRFATRLVRRALPVTAGVLLFAGATVAMRFVAGLGPVGTVASLEYALRLYTIPSSLLVSSAAAVVLPLSVGTAAADSRTQQLTHIRWSLFGMLPIAFALSAGARVIMGFVLGPGAEPDAVRAIATNTAALAASLPAMLFVNLQMRSDQAHGQFQSTMVGGVSTFLASGVSVVVLALRGDWALLGLAHTVGVTSVAAVVSGGRGSGRGRMVLCGLAPALGLATAAAGLALSNGRDASVMLLALGAGLTIAAWMVGRACVNWMRGGPAVPADGSDGARRPPAPD
jgi:peptidoglycan biosynthesis protein MviN/MurJ (putative lipid II flippase)